MDKLKKIIEGKSQWNELNRYLNFIEKNRESDSNGTLDNVKSLLESISKTILINKGVEFNKNINFIRLVKLAAENTPVFSIFENKDKESSKRIFNGIENIASGIAELRNNHGFFAHGRDVHSQKFDKYILNLVLNSGESLACFLIQCHGEDLTDRERWFYEDYAFFNEWYDNKHFDEKTGYTISLSFALFTQDLEAYKEEYNLFSNSPSDIQIAFDETEKYKLEILKIAENINLPLETVKSFGVYYRDLYKSMEPSLNLLKEFEKQNKKIIQQSLENIEPILENTKKTQEQYSQTLSSYKNKIKSMQKIAQTISKMNL